MEEKSADLDSFLKDLRCEKYKANFEEEEIECEDDLRTLTDDQINELVDKKIGPFNRIKERRDKLSGKDEKDKEKAAKSASKSRIELEGVKVGKSAVLGADRVQKNGKPGDQSFFKEEFAETPGFDVKMKGGTLEGTAGTSHVRAVEQNKTKTEDEDNQNTDDQPPEYMKIDNQ